MCLKSLNQEDDRNDPCCRELTGSMRFSRTARSVVLLQGLVGFITGPEALRDLQPNKTARLQFL